MPASALAMEQKKLEDDDAKHEIAAIKERLGKIAFLLERQDWAGQLG